MSLKTYEVLKTFTIEFISETGSSNMGSFYLEVGDFIFIDHGYWGRVVSRDLFGKDDVSRNFVETCVLKKILYKGGDIKKDENGEIYYDNFWQEEDNINLFNPLINSRQLTIEQALQIGYIVESVAHKRDDILKELGI